MSTNFNLVFYFIHLKITHTHTKDAFYFSKNTHISGKISIGFTTLTKRSNGPHVHTQNVLEGPEVWAPFWLLYVWSSLGGLSRAGSLLGASTWGGRLPQTLWRDPGFLLQTTSLGQRFPQLCREFFREHVLSESCRRLSYFHQRVGTPQGRQEAPA